MQYPSREAEILRLANDIAAGLAAASFGDSQFAERRVESSFFQSEDGARAGYFGRT